MIIIKIKIEERLPIGGRAACGVEVTGSNSKVTLLEAELGNRFKARIEKMLLDEAALHGKSAMFSKDT